MTFVLAADPAVAGLARARIRRWLTHARWPAQELDDIEYVVSEAVSNSAEHAYPEPLTGTVEVHAAIETLDHAGTRRVQVTVTDHGRWREPPADTEHRRRGLQLINLYMDTVTIHRGQHPPTDGTIVWLTAPPVPPPTR